MAIDAVGGRLLFLAFMGHWAALIDLHDLPAPSSHLHGSDGLRGWVAQCIHGCMQENQHYWRCWTNDEGHSSSVLAVAVSARGIVALGFIDSVVLKAPREPGKPHRHFRWPHSSAQLYFNRGPEIPDIGAPAGETRPAERMISSPAISFPAQASPPEASNISSAAIHNLAQCDLASQISDPASGRSRSLVGTLVAPTGNWHSRTWSDLYEHEIDFAYVVPLDLGGRGHHFLYTASATGELCIGCENRPLPQLGRRPGRAIQVDVQGRSRSAGRHFEPKFVLAPPYVSVDVLDSPSERARLYAATSTYAITTTVGERACTQNLRVVAVYRDNLYLYTVPADILLYSSAEEEGVLLPPKTFDLRLPDGYGAGLDHVYVFRAGGGVGGTAGGRGNSLLESLGLGNGGSFSVQADGAVVEVNARWANYRLQEKDEGIKGRLGSQATQGQGAWPVPLQPAYIGCMEGVAGVAVVEEGSEEQEGGLGVRAFDSSGRQRSWRRTFGSFGTPPRTDNTVRWIASPY